MTGIVCRLLNKDIRVEWRHHNSFIKDKINDTYFKYRLGNKKETSSAFNGCRSWTAVTPGNGRRQAFEIWC